MAKKKQTKSSPGKNKAKKAEKKPVLTAPEVIAAEAAYKSGDYAGLRRLALADGDLPADVRARIDTLYEMTRTDPKQWMVAIAAFVIAIIVAIVTLGG